MTWHWTAADCLTQLAYIGVQLSVCLPSRNLLERLFMENLPTPKGDNGRDATTGRFAPGWKGGPGNPHARRVADFRRVLADAVTDEDLHDLARTLVEKGKAGDVMAVREVFDRLLGKAKTTLAVETEPRYDPEDAKARLGAMLAASPSLRTLFSDLIGIKV